MFLFFSLKYYFLALTQ